MTFSTTGCVIVVFLSTYLRAQDVNTTHGRVTGQRISVLGQYLDVYYGIPFAKPPVGDLRFKRPQPADHWRPKIKDAREIKPSCQQQMFNFRGYPIRVSPLLMSEDCLYLNMWVPANITTGTKLATMVWIYGGSFMTGTINLALYDGKYLAAENNVIVISINYRLGAHGFLFLGADTFPGNQGLVDQALALKWIYENTERFGGDRNKITIFGESAGAVSVGHHLLSPQSRDYFTRAILESGVPNSHWASQSRVVGRRFAKRLADLTNCSAKTDGEIYRCLRQVSPENIIQAQNKMWVGAFEFGPVIDGDVLPDHPDVLIQNNSIKNTDILIGVNKDEGTLFLSGLVPDAYPWNDPITVSIFCIAITLCL